MGKLKAQKVTTTDTDGFNKTIEFEVLHQSHVVVNHNKFYCLEIQYNDDTEEWRLFSHYGRLGKTNIYDVRGPSDDEALVRKEFASILGKKKKGKKVKRDDGEIERECYEKIETDLPKVGSPNIRGKGETTVTVKKVDHISSSAYGDPNTARIVDQVIQENIHNITSNTTMTVSSNGLETPVGPVTKNHVAKARVPLMELKDLLDNEGDLDSTSKDVQNANNKYFSLIPHPFEFKIAESQWILDDTKLLEEFDLLDQLETAVSMGSSLTDTQQRMDALGTEMELLKDKKEWARIVKKFKNSKADNHRGSSVCDYDIKNIFQMKIPEERKRWEKKGKPMGKVKELFHGSKNCNILSILKNGLMVPPCNASHVTARMFGDGIYAAHNSTKALNYSIGFWSSNHQNKFDNVFLFLTQFAMGNPYDTYTSKPSGAPRGFDSIHAKRGRGLWNDEYIVYKLHQSSLTYMIELEED